VQGTEDSLGRYKGLLNTAQKERGRSSRRNLGNAQRSPPGGNRRVPPYSSTNAKMAVVVQSLNKAEIGIEQRRENSRYKCCSSPSQGKTYRRIYR